MNEIMASIPLQTVPQVPWALSRITDLGWDRPGEERPYGSETLSASLDSCDRLLTRAEDGTRQSNGGPYIETSRAQGNENVLRAWVFQSGRLGFRYQLYHLISCVTLSKLLISPP